MGNVLGLKSVTSMLDWSGTGEGITIRLFGTLFVNTVTIGDQLAARHQPITPPPPAPTLHLTQRFSREHLGPSAFSERAGSAGGRAPHLGRVSTLIKLSTSPRVSAEHKMAPFCRSSDGRQTNHFTQSRGAIRIIFPLMHKIYTRRWAVCTGECGRARAAHPVSTVALGLSKLN